MAKSFTISRKSGYTAGSFSVEKAKMDNTCGCGAVIKAGSKKVVFSSVASYPVTVCMKCASKLITVLKQITD